ncbi:MAG: hypothetical protein Kow0069_19630 [Promethearchaeota archaeon]
MDAGFNAFALNHPMGMSRTPPLGDPKWRNAYGKYLTAATEHLKAKGWLKHAYLYFVDEFQIFVPEGFTREGYFQFLGEFLDLINSSAPDLPVMTTTPPTRELSHLRDYFDVYCPIASDYNRTEWDDAMAEGKEAWTYFCVWPRAPWPNSHLYNRLFEFRVMLWQTFRYGLDGFLYWSSTAYYHGNYALGYNGWEDGWFVYPDEDGDGWYDSIRWENFRDAQEDFEYLWLCERLGGGAVQFARPVGAFAGRLRCGDPAGGVEFCRGGPRGALRPGARPLPRPRGFGEHPRPDLFHLGPAGAGGGTLVPVSRRALPRVFMERGRLEHVDVRSFVERQEATFRHEPVERVVWQPRFSDWYAKNHVYQLRRDMAAEQVAELAPHCPDLPPEVYGMEHVEVYDHLNASPRYPGECWPGMNFFSPVADPSADLRHRWWTNERGDRFHEVVTPHGKLRESWRAGSSYPVERVLKSRRDFPAVLYYVEHACAEYQFNELLYEVFLEENGGRCASVGSPWRSPYNKCIVELAGTKTTMLLMKRFPAEFDAFCEELARINSEVVMPALLESPIDYVSVGDNVDCFNDPPPVYEKYVLPYFQDVADACRKAGKFTFAHFDGNLRDLLPYFSEDLYPFDGVEAPTFRPQGDVTLEEFRRALGDGIVVLDGIPSTVFLPQFSEERFERMVVDVLEAFAPDLILGVSDEFSPNGSFRRLEKVAGIVEAFEPPR